jgi:hypothetical protein
MLKIDRGEQSKLDRRNKQHCSELASHYARVSGAREEFADMQHPRLYARTRPQGRISSVAKLLFGSDAPVECILVDYSAGGACLQLQKVVELPSRFEVLYGTTRKRCRVVWKRGMRIGVSF